MKQLPEWLQLIIKITGYGLIVFFIIILIFFIGYAIACIPSWGYGSLPDYLNIIVLTVTAVFIYKYVKDTNTLAKAQFIPAVGHLLQSQYIGTNQFKIILTLKNHSKFDVTSHVEFNIDHDADFHFWFTRYTYNSFKGFAEWNIPPLGSTAKSFNFSFIINPDKDKEIEYNIKKHKNPFLTATSLFEIQITSNSKYRIDYKSPMYRYHFQYHTNSNLSAITPIMYFDYDKRTDV